VIVLIIILTVLVVALVASSSYGWYLYIRGERDGKAVDAQIAKDRRERERVTGVIEQIGHRLSCIVPPKER
jgi:nicotinamide riboside transporter PnuC